jgi:hypothetical protein
MEMELDRIKERERKSLSSMHEVEELASPENMDPLREFNCLNNELLEFSNSRTGTLLRDRWFVAIEFQCHSYFDCLYQLRKSLIF